jgi:hypothetical protein
MNIEINNQKLQNYILLDKNLKPSYAKIQSAYLTDKEAQTKNLAFKMNRANKQYILEKDWK